MSNMFQLEIKDRNNISYTFLVTKDVFDLAHNDPSYAEKFLIMQKQKYPQLFKGTIPKMSNEQKVLELSDGAKTVKRYVPPDIYKRANIDLQYATQLFEKHNKEIDQQITRCIDTNVSVDKVEDTPQCIDPNISSEDMPNAYYDELQNDENIEAALFNRGTLRHHWTIEETKLLLSLYLVRSGPLNKGVTHNCFWNKISTEMRKNGYAFTASQCNSKLENLEKLYKKCCDHNRQSGNAPKTIEHYDILQEIFSRTPWMEPLSTAGSSTPLGQHLDQKLSSSSLKRCAASDKTDYMKELLQLKKQKLQNDKEYK